MTALPNVFRNTVTSPDAPVSQWVQEDFLSAVEHGNVLHWRAIIRAIQTDPSGREERRLRMAMDEAEYAPFAKSLLSAVLEDVTAHGGLETSSN